jgi:hypothetical protein
MDLDYSWYRGFLRSGNVQMAKKTVTVHAVLERSKELWFLLF